MASEFSTRPDPLPDTHKERREEKLQAKSRGLTVEEWRERKAKNQEKFRTEQVDKLEGTPLKLSFGGDLAIKGKVELAAWDKPYGTLLNFLKAAYQESGETDPEIINRKARSVQHAIIDMVGDDYLAMTSAAVLRFQGSTLTLAGVHSNKYGKRVEDIVQDRMLERDMEAARTSVIPATREPLPDTRPTVYIVGDKAGVRVVNKEDFPTSSEAALGGSIPDYNPADDGIVQREDGTWVSNGTKPQAGRNTLKPAGL